MTYLATFWVFEVLVVMIIVIEVAGCEGDIVVMTHLSHEHLLSLHLRFLRVRSQIGNCKIHLWLIYSSRGTLWLQVAVKLHFVPVAQRVENIWFVSPNQLEHDCRQIARQKSKGRLLFLTARHFPPSHDGGSNFSARCDEVPGFVVERGANETRGKSRWLRVENVNNSSARKTGKFLRRGTRVFKVGSDLKARQSGKKNRDMTEINGRKYTSRVKNVICSKELLFRFFHLIFSTIFISSRHLFLAFAGQMKLCRIMSYSPGIFNSTENFAIDSCINILSRAAARHFSSNLLDLQWIIQPRTW